MPLYRVEHDTPLTSTQEASLASAITELHSTRFKTARMFVNVEFVDVTTHRTYIGGRRRGGNHIKANVRSGPARSQQEWDDLCLDIQAAWNKIVGPGLAKVRRGEDDAPSTTLRSVILLGGMVGGLEAGFILPPAGGDVKWMHENWDAFQRKADEGDEEFVEMVKEIKERGLMGQTNGKSEAEKLNEMMGWGDHA